MGDKYEGHSPKTCNYIACNANTNTPCPFTKENKQPDSVATSCQHEWQQLVGENVDQHHFYFYCIFCKTITKQSYYNILRSRANRGRSKFDKYLPRTDELVHPC
jgi:hypothetical protein